MMCSTGKHCGVHWVASALVIIGALNWGLVAIDPMYNAVDALLGVGSMAARVVYGLVGIAALMLLVGCRCKTCMAGKDQMK